MEVLNKKPDWNMLRNHKTIKQLMQLSEHAGLVRQLGPRSVEELAMTIALIRPGKRHLQNLGWDRIRREIWKPDDTGYTFKKSHAIAYSLNIIVQLNMIKHGIGAQNGDQESSV